MLQFICHAKCTTCNRARKFLLERNIEFVERDIQKENPTRDELRAWLQISASPIRRLFNTSGMKYRALGLSKKLDDLSEDDALDLLAADGMLVKRPVLVGANFVLFGFKEADWEAAITPASPV
ncbi:MAG: Spx/MgsR family RNA polymerase-binding regulatory protein [Christensenellales bacterium]